MGALPLVYVVTGCRLTSDFGMNQLLMCLDNISYLTHNIYGGLANVHLTAW